MSDPKCFSASSSETGTYDNTQPNGGPATDNPNAVYFDGQGPQPSPTPTPSDAPSSSNTLPSCDEPRESLGLDEIPKSLVWGRGSSFETYLPDHGQGTVFVGAVDPAKPFKNSYTATATKTFEHFPLRATEGDGAVRVTFFFPEEDEVNGEPERCVRYSVRDIPVSIGKQPTVSVSGGRYTREGDFSFPAGNCVNYRLTPAKVQVMGLGKTVTVSEDDICSRHWSTSGRNTHYKLSMTSDGAKIVATRSQTNQDWHFRYRVTLSGKTAKQGRVTLFNTYHSGSRVYLYVNGRINDEFNNFCVNHGKTTYSVDNGSNLYCISSAFRNHGVSFK